MWKELRPTYGETVKVVNDWTAHCEERSTTVASSQWDGYGANAIASSSLSGNVAQTMMTAYGTGCLVNTVALANGEVLIAQREVWVS